MSESHLMQLVVAGAFAVDLIMGEYPDKIHPVLYMGKYINYLWGKRPADKGSLFAFGSFLVISGMVIFFLIPFVLLSFIPGLFSIVVAFFLLKPAFALKALIKAAADVKRSLEKGDLEEARRLTSWHLVSRDTSELSDQDVCGAVIESVAENLTDGLISPLFYFALGGVPAAWAYRYVNTCDSLIGYRKDDFELGGKFAARFDDVLNWIPARLCGGILVLSAMLTGNDWRNAWNTMLGARNETSSPNAGWTMAAMAGALGVKLEKRGEYLLDGGDQSLNFHFIDRALKLVIASAVIFIIIAIIFLEVIK